MTMTPELPAAREDVEVSATEYARAILNILEDFSAEKARLEAAQKAMLNILEDFDEAKSRVEAANVVLRREIADRRQAEAALVEKGLALSRSNAELEQFAYVASHDLQEPLRMVSSYMQLLARRYEGKLDPQADKYIHYAVDGAQWMRALIGGLLEYSRVGRRVAPGPVDADEALNQALANLAGAIEEHRAAISRAPLPRVTADRDPLVQVFQNLLANALKFHRPGQPPRIDIRAITEGEWCTFTVEDDGIGIDAQYADRIFVIFQRLHTRAEYPGTGIGLAVCKKVIDRLGGRIWVDSQPNRGARFSFSLPRASHEPLARR